MKRRNQTTWAIAGSVAAAAVLWIALFSCNLTNPFAAFSGVNIISNDTFSSSNWSITYLNSQTPAYSYLTFQPVTASAIGTTSGLPSGATDYSRLEIPSLLPNGDFENALNVSATGWTPYGATTPPTAVPALATTSSAASGAITGTSLHFALSPYQWMSYDLTANVADGFLPNAQYKILFDLDTTATSAAVFEYNDGTSIYSSPPWNVNVIGNSYSKIVAFPTPEFNSEVTALTAGTGYFTIGTIGIDQSKTLQTGNIDNLRVARVDVDPYIQLPVIYSDPTVHPDLVSGTYEFSLYAKLEDASQVTPSTKNSFNATGITLGINSAREEFSASSLSSSAWTKISMKALVQVNSFASASDVVMTLYVTPTDINAKDVGSVLISSPSLTFLPNG